jgi:ferritin-like metal-binding protein YciE
MPIEGLQDLLLYEISIMRDAERSGRTLLRMLAGRAGDERLARLLRTAEASSTRHVDSLNDCLASLDASTLDNVSETVEGISARFERFLTLRPAGPAADTFGAGTALRFLYFCLSSYRSLVDWAQVVSADRCVEYLRSNLAETERIADELERLSHDMAERTYA